MPYPRTQAQALKKKTTGFHISWDRGYLFSGWHIPRPPFLVQSTSPAPPSYSPNAWWFIPACYMLGVGSPGFHNVKGSGLRINTMRQVQACRHKCVWKTNLHLSGEENTRSSRREGGREHFRATTSSESRALGDLTMLSHPTHIRK